MNLNFPLIAVGILVYSTLTILITDGQSAANFKKIICTVYDKAFITNYSCSAKPKSRYKTIVNVNGYLGKRLDSLMVHHQMYKKFNVIYRPFLVNVTEDFCMKFINPAKSPYSNILLNIATKYTNLNHTCPYEGWVIMKDLELDLSSLRLLLPEGEYHYDIEPTVHNRQLLRVQFFFEVGGWKKKY